MCRTAKFLLTLFCLTILSSDSSALGDQQLAEKFAPRIYFHPREQYFPSSVEWYLERCQLVVEEKKGKSIGIGPLKKQIRKAKLKIVTPKPLTPGDIAGKDSSHFVDAMKNKKTYRGMTGGPGSDAPVYAAVFKKPGNPSQGIPATAAIQYWTFYPYNGPFQGLSLFGKDIVGYHEADWEVLIVYVEETKPDDWKITRIYFGRHGREFGEPMDPNDPAIEFVDGTHPIALAARGGHGLYPSKVSTRWTRKAADMVTRGSKYWDTWKKVELISKSKNWNTFRGRWGYAGGGPTGPAEKLLWERTEAGEGAPQVARYEVLKRYAAGTGDGHKKRRQMFSLGVSSHYSELCFELVDAAGNPVPDTDFKIMERKRLKRSNKEWYHIKAGNACVKSRGVEHKEIKGAFVEITRRGPKAQGPLTLVIKGKAPF